MARVAFEPKECEACGDVFDSASDIHKRPWNVGTARVSGTTRSGFGSSSRNNYGAGGFSHGTGTRQSHSSTSGRTITQTRQLWICNDCWSKQKARQARAFGFNITVLLLIALGVIAWIVFPGHSNFRAPNGSTSDGQNAVQPPSAVTERKAEPDVAERAGPPTSSSEDEQPAATTAPQMPAVTPMTNDGLRTAILQGLESGEPGRWQGVGLSGGYSFSSEQPLRGKVCRNFRYTVERNGEEQETHDGTACKPDAGDWAVNP